MRTPRRGADTTTRPRSLIIITAFLQVARPGLSVSAAHDATPRYHGLEWRAYVSSSWCRSSPLGHHRFAPGGVPCWLAASLCPSPSSATSPRRVEETKRRSRPAPGSPHPPASPVPARPPAPSGHPRRSPLKFALLCQHVGAGGWWHRTARASGALEGSRTPTPLPNIGQNSLRRQTGRAAALGWVQSVGGAATTCRVPARGLFPPSVPGACRVPATEEVPSRPGQPKPMVVAGGRRT